MKRFFFATVAALAMALPAAASEIRIAISKPPAYYDPRKASDSMTWTVLSQVYETPLLYTTARPNGAPSLFSDVARVDNKTYVGTIVWGIVYSDGEALTAAQMIAWLSTVRDISSRATMTAGKKGTRETITFHLKEPDQYFTQILMTNYCLVAKEKGKGVYLGTGPFVLGRHDDREIVLERNPHFHDAGEPKVDRLVFKVFPAAVDGTNPALLDAIRRDEVDFTQAVPLSSLPQLQGVRTAKTLVLESKNTGWITFNFRRPGINDPKVRHAIAELLDPGDIVRRLYPVGTRAATSFLPPALAAQVRGVDFDLHLKSDPAAAKRDLAAAGFGPEKKLNLTLLIAWASRPYCNNPVLFGELVKKQLEESGAIAVRVEQPASGDDYFRALLKASFDLAGNGWIADTPNPADFLEANFASSKINCLSNCNNMAGWADPKVDQAIRNLRATGAAADFQTVVDEIRRELPVFPIVHGPEVIVLSDRVHGIEPSTFSYVSFRTAFLGAP
ncbi:MAG: ABC transporter substrate-binding protein [Thermoanaerobaculia bacterium]